MTDFRDILFDYKSMYTKMALKAMSKPKKHRRAGELVGCCKCGRTNKTLYKRNNEYICKDCREEV